MIVKDQNRGANWARNEGFKQVDTEFVLFSDNDINWRENGISSLLEALESHPEASYSYGAYQMDGEIYCDREFDPIALTETNYISTMSLIRTKDFPGFDENIKRFQDWDLWLTMLADGKYGVYCDEIIFDTEKKKGISYMNPEPIEEAYKAIRDKHGI